MDHRVSYIEDIIKEDYYEWHHKNMFFNIKDGVVNITYTVKKTTPSIGAMFRRTARKRLEDFGLKEGVDFIITIDIRDKLLYGY